MATILDNAIVLVLNLKCTKGFWVVALIFHRYYVLEPSFPFQAPDPNETIHKQSLNP